MNGFVMGLSEYCHNLGRHESYPAINVTRSEAEFAYVSTVAFFSMLSRRLTKGETT